MNIKKELSEPKWVGLMADANSLLQMVMSVAKADIGLGLSDMLLQELTAMLAIFALLVHSTSYCL